MIKFDIKININELKDYSAFLHKSVKKRTLLTMIESFSYYVRELYLDYIKKAIFSRRYKGNWEPVDEEGYLEYLGVTPQEHIFSLIKDALEVKKKGYNFVIRFNPHYDYPGTKIPLIKVLRAINYGTSKFNARPAFRGIANDIEDNIVDLWRGYLTMKGVV